MTRAESTRDKDNKTRDAADRGGSEKSGSEKNGSEKSASSNKSNDAAAYKESAKDVAREAQSKAGEVKDKVVEEAGEAREELQDQALGIFKDLRGAVADQIARINHVLRTTEDEMREQKLDELARYPGRLAESIDEVNEYLRERSSGGMRRDFERAIKRSPVAVIGGLAAVGGLCAWYLRSDPAGVGDGTNSTRRSGAATDRGRSNRNERDDDDHASHKQDARNRGGQADRQGAEGQSGGA